MTGPAESIYPQLVEHGFDAAFQTRPDDGAILYANPAACRLFGYTLDEFRALGRSAVVDLADPGSVPRWPSVWNWPLSGGPPAAAQGRQSVFGGPLISRLHRQQRGATDQHVRVDLTEQAQREEALRVVNAELSRRSQRCGSCRGCCRFVATASASATRSTTGSRWRRTSRRMLRCSSVTVSAERATSTRSAHNWSSSGRGPHDPPSLARHRRTKGGKRPRLTTDQRLVITRKTERDRT